MLLKRLQALQRQESPLIFGTCKSVISIGSASLDHVAGIIADVKMLSASFILCKQADLIEESVTGQ